MAYNFYDTHTLLRSVELLPPVHTFLLDRYFPSNTASDVFSTDDVLVEYKEGNKKLAPFVVPRKGGMAIKRSGYHMERYTPPYIAPKRPLTLDNLRKRGFGEALYSSLTPEQRQGVMIMRDADEMRTMITRRKEAMAAETIFTNGCVMRHYIDDLQHYEEKEIRFYDEDTNPAVYTPAADWDTTENGGKQMMADIAAIAFMLTSRGLPATDVLCAPDVADIVLGNEYIQKIMDIRNYQVGNVAPATLPAGAALICHLNIKGRMFDFYSYDETYEADDGTVKQYVPAGHIAVGAPAYGRTLYGAVSQVEQTDGEFHTYTGMYVPKYISDANSNTRELILTSCPLLIPNNKNAMISAKVVGNA
jgi:hypothetical protein